MIPDADVRGRRVVRLTALVVAAAAFGWAFYLAFVGGVHVSLFGQPITSNEPLRPLLLAALALTVFILAHGVERSYRQWLTLTRRLSDRMLAVGLAGTVTLVGITYNSTAASGPDQYGYVSQADLWIDGTLHVPQPWAEHVPWPSKRWSFAPLGYRPVEPPDGMGQWENAPTYSPGLPLLMAAAKAAGGQESMFHVVPALGGVMVLATWGLGCRLGSSRAGLAAAWLVATSPVFLLHLVVPMSDVATAGAWTAAVFLLLGGGLPSTAASGLAAGVGLMIRPNLAPLAAILGLYVLARPAGGRRVAAAAAFGMPVALAALAVGVIYQSLYGSPFISGYGRFSDQFAAAHVLPNLQKYLGWFVETQTVAGLVGLITVLVPIRWVWTTVRDRRVLALIAALVVATWVMYFGYLVFDNFRYLRFLLVTWPFVMLGIGMVAVAIARLDRPGPTLLATGVVISLGILGWRLAAREGAFEVWRIDRRFVSAALLVRDLTPPNSAVLAMIHSGSLRYYGGRMTIRYDVLDREWLDRGVDWLRTRGVPVYALLEDWEMEPFADRFAGEQLTTRLEGPPLAVSPDGAIRLYDLSGSPAPEAAVTSMPLERLAGRLRSQPPAPTPRLVFAR